MHTESERYQKRKERGFILISMTAAAIALIGAMGLAVDMGHIFIVKNETQAFVDAAALAAALHMDGTAAGLTRADSEATGLSNKWNFSTTTVASPTVEYGAASTGPWYTSANVTSPATMLYSRVSVTVAPNLYFIPVVLVNKVYSTNVKSQAVAGQVDFANNTSIVAGLGPFAGVASDATGPNFGYVVGNEYDIQWPQYNGNRGKCKKGTILDCFVSPPCANETTAAETEVVNYWGPSTNGYWGSNSTSLLNDYILNLQQLAALSIGTDITPYLSSGNKQGTAKVVDDRVNQDPVNYGNNLNAYLANSSHNGRRLMPAPVVLPSASGSPVVGYGLFFLESNQTSAGHTSGFYQTGVGNDPYCAIYAGPFVFGATNPGAGGSAGGSRVKLVQ